MIVLNLEGFLCIVLDILLFRETLAFLAPASYFKLLSLMEELIYLVALNELAHPGEVRVREVTFTIIIKELKALIDIFLGHYSSQALCTLPELILVHSSSLLVVSKQAVHPRQCGLSLAHPLP